MPCSCSHQASCAALGPLACPQLPAHHLTLPVRTKAHIPGPAKPPAHPAPPAEVGQGGGDTRAHQLNEVCPEVLVHQVLPLPRLVSEAEIGGQQLLVDLWMGEEECDGGGR